MVILDLVSEPGRICPLLIACSTVALEIESNRRTTIDRPSRWREPISVPQESRQSPAFARSKLKMYRARVIASCSLSLLAGDFDKLRDRSRIAASASLTRCSNLLRSDSMMAAR